MNSPGNPEEGDPCPKIITMKEGKKMREVWKVLGIVAVVITLALSMSPGQATSAEKTFEFKISVDTVPNHPRNMGLVIFIEELQKRSGGRLVPKYYHSAQLYKDAHVTKALRTGTVEMAVPGNWLLEGFDTSTSLTMLPMFFGQPGKITEDLIDGEVGKAVNKSLEKKVGVKSPGRWFELGYDQTWTRNKKITKMEDFKGLKIRHSGAPSRKRGSTPSGPARYSLPGRTYPWLWCREQWTASAPPPKAWKAPSFTRQASSMQFLPQLQRLLRSHGQPEVLEQPAPGPAEDLHGRLERDGAQAAGDRPEGAGGSQEAHGRQRGGIL